MGLFDRKKTADEPKACCCGGAPAQETAAQANPEGDALVKVLGSGCPKCRALSAAAEAALAELNDVHVPIEREPWLDALGRYILASAGGRS
mgnify:CR=1 FL=1